MSQVDKVKELTDKLEEGVKSVFQSDHYKDYLKTMSKFHRYSSRNSLLIFLQNPKATHVAGYQTWQRDFNRHVKRGEVGIRIFAPAPYKVVRAVELIDQVSQQKLIENIEDSRMFFKAVCVFDISQTDGEPLPELVNELQEEVKDYNLFFNSITLVSPVLIGFENINSGAKGYFDRSELRIAIKEGMGEAQTIKTAIHEIAHVCLHNNELKQKPDTSQLKDRHTEEVEAESVAYTVCQHFGIDTSDYSFGYVAAWSSGREVMELKSSLETIRSTASELIISIEEQMKQLTSEKFAAYSQDEDELER